MEQPLFHVLLEGRKVGPYDRRTLVGMRVRNTLADTQVLVAADGAQLTVADLIGPAPPAQEFNPQRTTTTSAVRARYTAASLSVQGRGADIPAFQGEVEVRVHPELLRIAGRYRKGLGWKDDRVKLPLADIVHAGADGSSAELGLRSPDGSIQRLRLDFPTAQLAHELVHWLPGAQPWPQARAAAAAGGVVASHHALWIAVASTTLAVGIVVAAVLARRLY